MSYITILPSGEPRVNKELAFCSLLDGHLPDAHQPLSVLFSDFDKRVRLLDNRVTTGALSNVHGDWYEWLIAIAAWNHCAAHPTADLAILLPNVLQFQVNTLYEDRLSNLITDLIAPCVFKGTKGVPLLHFEHEKAIKFSFV